ncbi:hypothetical protein VTH8203_02382 [Vibrio thalassae]|uniref:YecM protein n=1 Tax=Vibrio thalassae TaxID=1243014 RepID=A0A240EL68_9VIBR|nr:VOC family protein [Vibrio thalassae]SNX48745.1 hypothetical protein VTH8203_02382 [Vibrio thalassae]
MEQTLLEKGLVPSQMLSEIDAFLDRIQALCSKLSIDLADYQADHIALRINDFDVAKAAHTAWLEYGNVISEAQINGRPIIVLQFDQAITSYGWSIECLELPYPAVGKTHPIENWEHVEFVVPSTATTTDDYLADLCHIFPALANRLAQLDDLNIKMKLSSPKGEGERLANPTVAFKHDNICIKLHPHSLKHIVASEQADI